MLVDPVADDAADRAPVPPRPLRCISSQPGAGDVPVVAHVVVVPEHRDRRRSRRASGSAGRSSSPRRARCTPRSRSPPRRGRRGAAPGPDPLARLRRALVDVDLVAEQEELVRPVRRGRRRTICAGEHPQRVDLPARLRGCPWSRCRAARAAGRRGRSRSRCRAGRRRPRVRIALGGRSEVGSRPAPLPSSATSYS